MFGQPCAVPPRFFRALRGPFSVQDAGLVGGFRRVSRDQVAGQRLGFQRQVPELSSIVPAETFLEPVLILVPARTDLAAVAPGCAETRAVGVDHHNVQSLFRGVERGR